MYFRSLLGIQLRDLPTLLCLICLQWCTSPHMDYHLLLDYYHFCVIHVWLSLMILLSSLKFTKKNKSKCSKIHLLLGLGFALNVWRETSMLSVFEIQTTFLISFIIKLMKIMRQDMIFKRAMNPFLIWTKYASNNTIVVILSYY